jgi:hypothetical protein
MNLLYVKILGGAIVLFGIWFNGYSVGHNQLTKYKLEQETQTRQKEFQQQTIADKIEKDKNAQIKAINDQLVNAISELRKRPNRPENSNIGQGGTGATLYAEDAEFLIREASRADTIRTGLDACYKQYDAIK